MVSFAEIEINGAVERRMRWTYLTLSIAPSVAQTGAAAMMVLAGACSNSIQRGAPPFLAFGF